MRNVLFAIFVGLQLADVFSTLHAIHNGAVELNPLIAPGGHFSLTLLIVAKMSALLVGSVLIYRISAKRPELQTRRAILYLIFLAVISISNWTF